MGDGAIYSTIAGVVLVLVALVALVGYPALIWISVLAAWAALVLIVVLSAGDMLEKPSRPAAQTQRLGATASA